MSSQQLIDQALDQIESIIKDLVSALGKQEDTQPPVFVPKQKPNIWYTTLHVMRVRQEPSLDSGVLMNAPVDFPFFVTEVILLNQIVWGKFIYAGQDAYIALESIKDEYIYCKAIPNYVLPDLTPSPAKAEFSTFRLQSGGWGLQFQRGQLGSPRQRLMGFNCRELPYVNIINADQIKDGTDYVERVASESGIYGTMCRFYAPIARFSTAQIIQHVSHAIERLKAHGVIPMVCLTDTIGDPQGQYPPSLLPHLATGRLRYIYYKNKSYRKDFYPYLRELIPALMSMNYPMILQIDNEGTGQGEHDANTYREHGKYYLDYAIETVEFVRSLSGGKHPVGLGVINSTHAFALHDENEILNAYKSINPDYIQVHQYQKEDSSGEWKEMEEFHRDLEVSLVMKVPFIVDEFGTWRNHEDKGGWVPVNDRVRSTDHTARHNEMLNDGVWGYLHWGYMPTSSDFRIGDHKFGLDDVLFRTHSDRSYYGIRDLMKQSK